MTIDVEQVRTEVIEFGSLSIQFDDRVLRPRRWTTAQSAWASALLDGAPEGPVLELCAGVGHIGLLAMTGQSRPLVLVDSSQIAWTTPPPTKNARGWRAPSRSGAAAWRS